MKFAGHVATCHNFRRAVRALCENARFPVHGDLAFAVRSSHASLAGKVSALGPPLSSFWRFGRTLEMGEARTRRFQGLAPRRRPESKCKQESGMIFGEHCARNYFSLVAKSLFCEYIS